MSKMMRISELEQKNAQKPYYGNGIALAGGFDLGAAAALDSRSTAKTLADRDAHVTGNRAYEGMLVYVEETQKTYQLIDGQWVEFGFNDDQFQAGIEDSLTSEAADKALSARQGKILNEKIESTKQELQESIDELEGKVTANEESIKELEAKDVELEEKIAELVEKDTELSAKDAELEGKITDLETELDGKISDAKAELEGEIANLQAKDQELLVKIETNSQSIATNSQNISNLDSKIDQGLEEVNSEIARVESLVGDADSKVDELENKLNQDIADAKAEAIEEAVQTSKEYVDAELEKANQNVADLEGRVETLENEMDVVEEGLAQEIKDREAADLVLDGKITAVEGRMDAAEAAIEAVEGEVARVEGKVDALETKTTQDIANALKEAKDYTDEREVEITKAIETAKEEAIEEANQYADLVAGQSLEDAKAYTDERVEGLKSEITNPEEGQALDVKFGNVIVAGDLEVKGSVKSIERTELHVEDSIIEVNSAGADVTTSDVHLGLRANLGNGDFSEIVYCPDTQKWVVVDTHPKTRAAHGEDEVVKTIAFVEDMEAGNAEIQDKVNEVEGKVESLEEGLVEAEGRLDAVEEELAELKAVENVKEKIAAPGATMNLSKVPFNGEVELFINGLLYVEGFTVAGNVISWTASEFEIESDDTVIAKYVVK